METSKKYTLCGWDLMGKICAKLDCILYVMKNAKEL